MKLVKVKKGFPYFGTKVPLDRTISQIKEMLRKFGSDKIAEMDDTNSGAHVIAFTNRGKSYLISFPETVIEKGYHKKVERRPDIGARIIHDRIKAMLVSVELEFLVFEQAMLPYLLVRGADGSPTTLEERAGEIQGTQNQLFLPLMEEKATVKRP
jgi:hypothetical protein